ncbi:hypothetical protein, partial [Microvirga aerophila]|uniref:hypothetical protein n=1 Tax=Microvirga aerophila TaxID=670291 RepID=UPI001FEDD4C7
RHDRRDFGEELPREEAEGATGLGQAVAGFAMKKDTPLRRLERTYAASQQACDDAGQRSPDPDVAKPTLPSL